MLALRGDRIPSEELVGVLRVGTTRIGTAHREDRRTVEAQATVQGLSLFRIGDLPHHLGDGSVHGKKTGEHRAQDERGQPLGAFHDFPLEREAFDKGSVPRARAVDNREPGELADRSTAGAGAISPGFVLQCDPAIG